jgi:hypothetical protein
MKAPYFTAAVAALALLVSTGAQAQSLKIKKIQADQEKRLQDHIKSFNETCGTNIAVGKMRLRISLENTVHMVIVGVR